MSDEENFDELFPSLKVKVKDGVVCPNCGEKHLRSPKNSIVWTSEVRECCVDKAKLREAMRTVLEWHKDKGQEQMAQHILLQLKEVLGL